MADEFKLTDLVRSISDKRFVKAGDLKRLVARLNKLSLIMQASRSLMGSVDVKKLLWEVLNKARIVMNADKASIFMIDEARGEIYASVTLDGSEIRLPRGTGIIGFVADSGETVNIPDAYEDARFSRENDIKINYRTRAILCMPVRNQHNHITGAIQLLNKVDGDYFTHEDEEMLTAFSAMVGVCLENARAYEELAAERNSLEEKVVERTAELALAKAETDQILQAVEEGLFLLYRSGEKFIIGASHSEALATIFDQTELRSKNFIEAIATFLEPAIIDKTTTFLELMFDAQKKQTVLLKLNPLANVKAVYGASGRRKQLRFAFNRVGDAGSVDHLMVTVSDISHETELQQRLKDTEEQNRRHMELLLAILQSEPATLAEFLDDLDQDLAESQRLFDEALMADALSRKNLLTEAFRVVHSVKGNSSLLNFQSLTQLAHNIENAVDEMLPLEEIPVTRIHETQPQLHELNRLSEELRSWLWKIGSFQSAMATEKKTDFLLRTLQTALEKAALSQNKQISFDSSGFSSDKIPTASRKPVKEILMHLVRNAAIHGIEPAADRRARGKAAEGRVILRSDTTGGTFTLTLEDDGRGIDGEGIAQKLLAQNQITATELAAMDEAAKLRLIFRAGASTLSSVDEFAGRGMGMNIVEENARKIGAELRVETERQKFTRFSFRFSGQP